MVHVLDSEWNPGGDVLKQQLLISQLLAESGGADSVVHFGLNAEQGMKGPGHMHMTSGVSRLLKSPKRRRSSGLTPDSSNPYSVKNCRTGLRDPKSCPSMPHRDRKRYIWVKSSAGDDLRQYRARVEALLSIQR